MEDNFLKALEVSKRDFLANLPDEVFNLQAEFSKNHNKLKSDINISKLSDLVRKLHNLKSVAGSYGLDFIVSAVRNILDHTSYIYDLKNDQKIDLSLSVKIFDLLSDYVSGVNYSYIEGHVLKLDDLVTNKSQKRRVLLVEKDERLIAHFKEILEKHDLAYSIADNGHEALGRLLDERFDLLITDLHVGKLDGPSLIASTRVSNGVNKTIKTLMLSVSYFDLLPSISMPDFFISKNENILIEFERAISKFVGPSEIKEEGQVNILSLDDDKNIHDLLNLSFKDHQIKYRSALNGTIFIEEFIKNKPDLVLLDLILENESGVEVILKLKQKIQSFDVPVIVLTSLDGNLRSELIDEIPFIVGTLSKPFTPKSMAKDVLSLFKQTKMGFGLN